MTNERRVFISFAVEDKFARDNLVYQAQRQESAPFSFQDFSVKEPWSSAWKTNCRTKIKGCNGVIAFISANIPKADGARWEIKCAKEESVPLLALWVYKDDKRGKPEELGSTPVKEWTWDNVKNFLESL